ncbi:hypothetical protein TrCOL_g2362 [Triparma columacea]|uniref:Uncharacterized protein n=1 Tax=Triparma columacea TaxID=722753 RepID=A0A9W7GHW8_9STRA|nr:hypothetical protein TrCOL_g2362 [Triparma columacea]
MKEIISFVSLFLLLINIVSSFVPSHTLNNALNKKLIPPLSTTSSYSPPRPLHPYSPLHSSFDSSDSSFTSPSSPQTAFTINEFTSASDLHDILTLSSQPLPNRPDGVVVVVKYTSLTLSNTECDYLNLSRAHPDTIFLRCFKEYSGSQSAFSDALVSSTPTYDIYDSGRRVGRVIGEQLDEVDGWIRRFGYVVSKTDLFSEDADVKEQLKLKSGKGGGGGTPRTTGRFVPGYDWDKKGGFFDETAENMENDFIDTYGDWRPQTEDD